MTDFPTIQGICFAKGKREITKKDKIKNKEDIKTLSNLLDLFKLLKEFKTLDFSSLPPKAIGVLYKKSKSCPSPCNKDALVLIKEALEKTLSKRLRKSHRNRIEEVLEKVNDFIKQFSTLKQGALLTEYHNTLKIQLGHLNNRVETALSTTIQKFALKYKLIKPSEDIGFLTEEKMTTYIWLKCEPTKTKSMTQPTKKPITQPVVPKDEYPYLTHRIKVLVGYQHIEGGADDVQVIPTEELGLVPQFQGMLAASYDTISFGGKVNWKMSYDTTGYDPKGNETDQPYFNNQLFLTGWFKKTGKAYSIFTEAGYLVNEKVYPTMEHQNLSGIGINIKGKINIKDFVDISPALYLAAGQSKNNVKLDPSDFNFSHAGGQIKLGFTWPVINFFVKGGAGIRPGQESVPEKQMVSELSEYEVAWEAGAGIQFNSGNHQIGLDLAYRNNPLNPTSRQDIDRYRGFSTELFWNHSSSKVGAKVFYNNTEGRNLLKVGASYKFLSKDIFWKQKVGLGLFANFSYTSADQYTNPPFINLDGEAIGIGGGLEISIEREKPSK